MTESTTGNSSSVIVVIASAVLLAVLVGWILKAGESIMLPIFAAVISVYILSSAADALGRWPATRWLPSLVRHALVIVTFTAAVIAFGWIIYTTVQQLSINAPHYQKNLTDLVDQSISYLGLETSPDWQSLRVQFLGQFKLQNLIFNTINAAGSALGVVFLIVIYAMFLMAERGSFRQKLTTAFPEQQQLGPTLSILGNINKSIGDYLAVKTLINIILGLICFAILWLFDVDYALFWAIIIGLANYVPYFGSLIGVAFPVILTLAQFGSFETTAYVAVALILAQVWVGNFLEPKLVGEKVNLSPFVVLVALSFWTAIWGLPGAILAIPMTSMFAIVFSAFKVTRPIAVLLANDVRSFKKTAPPTHA